MSISENNSMDLVPSYLVVQTESILIEFEPQSALPINLETTNVCDCASLVMYSTVKGIAYLSHIYFKEMDTHINSYENSILKIIKTYELNSHNTVVALIGGQDRTLTWIGTFEKTLQPYFSEIKKEIGGEKNLERSVELTADSINIVKILYDNPRKISYKPLNHISDLKRGEKISKAELFVDGKSVTIFTTENLSEINAQIKNFKEIIKDQKKLTDYYEKIDDNLRRRLLFTENYASNKKYLTGATVSKIEVSFDLKKITSEEVSKVTFNCAVFKPKLFSYLKTQFGLATIQGMSYNEINRFRFPVIQKGINDGQLTLEKVIAMSDKEIEDLQETKQTTDETVDKIDSPLSSPRSYNCTIS